MRFDPQTNMVSQSASAESLRAAGTRRRGAWPGLLLLMLGCAGAAIAYWLDRAVPITAASAKSLEDLLASPSDQAERRLVDSLASVADASPAAPDTVDGATDPESSAAQPASPEDDSNGPGLSTSTSGSSDSAADAGAVQDNDARFDRAFVKGRRFMMLRQHNDAARCFREALAIREHDVQAHYQLGLACVMSNDMAGARTELQVLDDLDKSHANLLRNLIR
jgi:hypothetical protein